MEKRESSDIKNGIYKPEKIEGIPKRNENLLIAQHEVGEDDTKYGEFISTYFAWIPLSKQKEKAKEMEEMTKRSKNKNDF